MSFPTDPALHPFSPRPGAWRETVRALVAGWLLFLVAVAAGPAAANPTAPDALPELGSGPAEAFAPAPALDPAPGLLPTWTLPAAHGTVRTHGPEGPASPAGTPPRRAALLRAAASAAAAVPAEPAPTGRRPLYELHRAYLI